MQNAETEFGVDEPYLISKNELPAEMVTKYSIQNGITILPDLYQYEFKEMSLIYRGDTIPGYGKVKLKINVE